MLIYLAGHTPTDDQEREIVKKHIKRLFSYVYVIRGGGCYSQWQMWKEEIDRIDFSKKNTRRK